MDPQLNQLRDIAVDVIVQMAEGAGAKIDGLAETMGGDVTLMQPTTDAVAAVIEIVRKCGE